MKTRVIPVLLLRKKGLYKTVKFKDPRYIGDPINSVRIFNEKEVDEIAFIDISATPEGKGPDFEMLEDIAGEAFMPMSYGGGITTFEQVQRIMGLGFEKVIFNAASFDQPDVMRETARVYGAQAVIACLDVRKTLFGRYELYSHSGAKKRPVSLLDHLAAVQANGAGEILINNIDRDGTMGGYDIGLIRTVTEACSVPVIACGGAGTIDHLEAGAKQGGASAVAAGSMFVYKGVHRAVLINYPERRDLRARLP